MRAVDQKKQTEPCVSWKLLDQPLFQLHRRPATTVTVLESPLYLQINPQEMPPHRPALFLGFLFHRPPFTTKTGFSPWDGFFSHTHTHTRKKKELELSWMKVSPFISLTWWIAALTPSHYNWDIYSFIRSMKLILIFDLAGRQKAPLNWMEISRWQQKLSWHVPIHFATSYHFQGKCVIV